MITMPITIDGIEYMPLQEVLDYFGIKDRGTLKKNFPELKPTKLRNDRRSNYYRRDLVEQARANLIYRREDQNGNQ